MYERVVGPWNEKERYQFGVSGYLVCRDTISAARLKRLNELTDENGPLVNNGRGDPGSHFLDWGPEFRELLVHPDTLGAVKELCGGHLVRLDNAYPIVQSPAKPGGLALHGDGSLFTPDVHFLIRDGALHSGLTTVTFALTDQGGDLGGFCCIPGTQNATLSRPDDLGLDHEMVVCPRLDAGDALIFTEALTHGTRQWAGDFERRALLIKYAPGNVAWAEPFLQRRRFLDLMDTEEQRQLLAVPSVERWAAPRNGWTLEDY